MAENKTQKTHASPDDFLSRISDKRQRQDSIAICKLMQEATGEEPEMWGESIVGFGSYRYKYASGREADWMLTGFSPRKGNITVYIMSGFDDYAAASGFDPGPLLEKLGPHSTGKSCLYIKRLSDIDTNVLKDLIKKSVDVMKNLNHA